MLKPAILYKEEIVRKLQESFYTDDMLYVTGSIGTWIPQISECPDQYTFQYAIVNDSDKLIGYMAYNVNWYDSKVYNFGLFSFDKGNVIVGKEVFEKMEELVNNFHSIYWRAVSTNPACRSYDHFVERHGGTKHILKDYHKDKQGNYYDDIIYEIVN